MIWYHTHTYGASYGRQVYRVSDNQKQVDMSPVIVSFLSNLVYIYKYLEIIPTVSSVQISYFFDKRKLSRQMRLNVNICNEKITMKKNEICQVEKKEKKH